MPPSPTKDFLFPQVSDEQWGDWHWQLKNAIHSLDEAAKLLNWPQEALLSRLQAEKKYGTFTTPFYLSRAKELSWQGNDPVLMQALPDNQELADALSAEEDPFNEEPDSPLPRLVHRYGDRALMITCGTCAVHCRHCMRKRVWSETPLGAPSTKELEEIRLYLTAHTEIREVLISGGDPLTLEDHKIQEILEMFAQVPTLEMLRIGSRTLTALPQRFTPELCAILEASPKTIWMASHFNHPNEISLEAEKAVRSLMKAGVAVVNQAVLLKGINDDAPTLQKLFTELLRIRIKPYYLFHGDPVQGTTCFRTGLQKGLEILQALHHETTGMALPAFAFDLPQGGGKIRLEPDFTRQGGYLSRKGEILPYPDQPLNS